METVFCVRKALLCLIHVGMPMGLWTRVLTHGVEGFVAFFSPHFPRGAEGGLGEMMAGVMFSPTHRTACTGSLT